MKAVITVTGKDTVGIIAEVAGVCANHGANILDITQSVIGEYFAMIMLADISKLNKDFSSFVDALTWSFRKFFESTGESVGNFLLMGRWTVEGVFVSIALPLMIIGELIEYPFHMLFGEI
jgi:ACT domain-containing protein